MPSEKNAIYKDPGGKLNIALVYPNTYWVGMSNLGLHTVYSHLNAHPGIVCERFFLDMQRSIEHSRPLQDFHMIAFTIPYELDWINAVKILIENKIPVKRMDRKSGPIVIAGGPSITLNPEPIADSMDALFLGDGEGFAEKLHESFFDSGDMNEFLERLSSARGIYVPSFTYPKVSGDNAITSFVGPRPIVSVTNPLDPPAHTAIITSETVFGDMFMIETARGCPWKCKFCSAKAVYFPYRPAPLDVVENLFDKVLGSGLKLGLVSSALNDHPKADDMYSMITRKGLKIAPPSLRIGRITDRLIELLRYSKVRGVTLAPETGSQDIRYSVGKHITDDMILEDIERLVSSGIRDIKLYFLIGLPGERITHVNGITELVKRIRHVFVKVSRGNKRMGQITVSINTMVPKPHTPYEREPMINPREAKSRIKRISRGLSGLSNVFISYEGPKWAYIQSILARGDRAVLDLLIKLAKTESSDWGEVMRQWPRNPDYYALRKRETDEILPWSFYGY